MAAMGFDISFGGVKTTPLLATSSFDRANTSCSGNLPGFWFSGRGARLSQTTNTTAAKMATHKNERRMRLGMIHGIR
jgi:hypothetical protein